MPLVSLRGAGSLVLTPTELLARLSLLVAPPRYPLVRYGGLFAPAHGLRKAIVSRAPGPPREEGCCPARGAGETQEASAGKEANAERPPSSNPKEADAGLAAALLAVAAEVTETATTAGTKRVRHLSGVRPFSQELSFWQSRPDLHSLDGSLLQHRG